MGRKKTSYAYEGASMTPAIRYYIGQMLYTSGTSTSPLLLSLFKWGIRSANCCNRTGAIDNRCVRQEQKQHTQKRYRKRDWQSKSFQSKTKIRQTFPFLQNIWKCLKQKLSCVTKSRIRKLVVTLILKMLIQFKS